MHHRNEPATAQHAQSRRRFLSRGSKLLLTAILPPVRCLPQLQAFLLETAGIVGIDLAKKLYDKLLEYVSGHTLSSVFPEPTIADVKGWIQNAVLNLEAKIDQLSRKIDRDNLISMQSDLDAIRNQFADYASLPPGLRNANRQLLFNCEAASARLLSLSQNYDQAFFLSSVTLAHRLLTRYALYELDSESGQDASGHVVSLISTGEMQRYFSWAAGARARLVDSLAPQYSINCAIASKPLLVGLPTTRCEIFRRGKVVSDTGTMTWPISIYKTELEARRASMTKAMDRLPMVSRGDVSTWRKVNRSSGAGIAQGAKCLQAMYYKVTGHPCPAFFDEARLQLSNTALFSTGWDGQLKAGRPWGP